MHKSGWDDLKYVLAVAKSGSVNAAAKSLGVNHATVLRRISAFEEAHGAVVFDRSAQGYTVRPEQARLIALGQEAEAAFDRVGALARGDEDQARTQLRLTTTDSFAAHVMPHVLSQVTALGIAVELSSNNEHADFGRLRTDVTVRPALQLADGLVGEAVASLRFAVFRARGYLGNDWLGVAGPLERTRVIDWYRDTGHLAQVTNRADSFLALRELAAQGFGAVVLPAFLGRSDARLEQVGAPVGDDVPVWVAARADLGDEGRLTRARQVLSEAIAGCADWLGGDAPPPGG